METIKNLLDEIKAKNGITTDYGLAKFLEIPRPRVHEYYKGKGAPDAFVCMKIAESLGRPLAEIITAVEIAAEKNASRREAWLRYAKSLNEMAAAIMLYVMIGVTSVTLLVTSPAEAQERQGFPASDVSLYKLCAYLRGQAALAIRMLNNFFGRFYCPV